MATYKLSMRSINARADGNLALDMWVLDDQDVQRLHKTVLVPYTDIEAALALPTTAEKVAAAKAAIWNNRNNKTPIWEHTSDWEFGLFAALIGSVNQTIALMFFITDTLSLSLPFDFTIEG